MSKAPQEPVHFWLESSDPEASKKLIGFLNQLEAKPDSFIVRLIEEKSARPAIKLAMNGGVEPIEHVHRFNGY